MGTYHPGDARQAASTARKRERNIAHGSPIANTSVTRGGMDVAAPDGVKIQTVPGGAPGLSVEGLQEVSGELSVTGELNVSGEINVSGDLNATGDVTASGSLDISGDATLRSDLNVTGGGSITAGDVTIEPSGGGGVIRIGSATIAVGSGGVNISLGSATVYVGSSVSMSIGTASVTVDSGGVLMSGLQTIPRASANNAVVGSLWVNALGRVYRVV